jgi:hypothetical protein
MRGAVWIKVLLLGLALAVSVVATGCGQSSAHKASAAERDRTMAQLDRIVRTRVDSSLLPGIVAGMVFPDGSTRVVAYGDAGGGKPLDAGSAFEIGSITNVFTASLLSDMVQRGQVKLADPASHSYSRHGRVLQRRRGAARARSRAVPNSPEARRRIGQAVVVLCAVRGGSRHSAASHPRRRFTRPILRVGELYEFAQ